MKYSDGWYFGPPQVNIGDDAAKKGLNQVLAAATIYRQHLANKMLMKRMTLEQWREHNNAMNFSICTKTLKSSKVRNHDYLMGEYRGPAHV